MGSLLNQAKDRFLPRRTIKTRLSKRDCTKRKKRL